MNSSFTIQWSGMMIEPNDCKEERYCEEEVEGVSISIIYFSVTNYMIIERRDMATLVTWLLLLVIF